MAVGPRPWTIWLFCLVNLALASYRTVLYLLNLRDVQPMFEELAPWFEWNRDWVIVATSAWLTIDLIPVTLVWAFASRFARWFILSMAGLQGLIAIYDTLVRGAGDMTVLAGIFGSMIPVALAVLLFLPASQAWFEGRSKDEARVFE
jgi:hypothetical protein